MSMIPVKVDQIFLSNMGFVVMLKGLVDTRSLPIFIGAAEAQSIVIHMNNVQVPRPLTHDLLKNILDFMECRLKRVEVTHLEDGTFFARLVLERDTTEMEMDSRPSDAIALALRFGAPIGVADAVMKEAGRVYEEIEYEDKNEAAGPEEEGKQIKRAFKELSPVEVLKRDLTQAVNDERYEDAARLRDEIKRLENTHTHN